MSECGPIRRRYVASKERQMFVAAYTPVIVFALLVVIAEIARIRQHQQEAAVA
jgi:uncharacterized membrane protein YoaK (UPF0700 family)